MNKVVKPAVIPKKKEDREWGKEGVGREEEKKKRERETDTNLREKVIQKSYLQFCGNAFENLEKLDDFLTKI